MLKTDKKKADDGRRLKLDRVRKAKGIDPLSMRSLAVEPLSCRVGYTLTGRLSCPETQYCWCLTGVGCML